MFWKESCGLSAAGSPRAVYKLKSFMYEDTKECGFTTDNIEVLKMHERAKHDGPKEITDVIKETPEAKVKEEVAK